MFRVLLLVALVPALASATEFFACGGGRPLPTSVNIEGCPSGTCNLVRGSDVIAFIDFTAGKSRCSVDDHGCNRDGAGRHDDYPLGSNSATCNFLQGSSCPLSAGEDVTYRLTMPILSIYPLVSLTIEIDVVDAAQQSVACFSVNAQVVTAN
ncbi:AGAP002804-PA-like protein [Anopheles sinensis]|uniref:AGAP002804-PA-like protein n=1 Tax=Anopheles sinensis TaxID=74873 RepID=A0A084VA65_ANOSI|nr:AGAP002804-PA-like protein [Anopheles sinensis]